MKSLIQSGKVIVVCSFFILTGCASGGGSKVVEIDYTPETDEKLAARPEPAKVTKESAEALNKKGYIDSGQISVKHIDKVCFGGKCTENTHSEDPTTALLKDAAKKGGDLVSLSSDNSAYSDSAFTKGDECRSFGNTVRHFVVNNVSYSELVTQCIEWSTVQGEEFGTRSSGTVWSYEPELAVNYDNINYLVAAAAKGDMEGTRKYIAMGTNVNSRNFDGNLALIEALKNKRLKIASLLLKSGANPDIWYDGHTLLHEAAYINAGGVAELLISKGAEVNKKDKNGKTPLHKAAFRNAEGVAELLISKGANVNAMSKFKETPLHMAVFKNAEGMVALLINKGANVNAKDKDGKTPIYKAISYNAEGVVALLISKGANVNAKSISGKTPLHVAASYGFEDVVALLIKQGVEVNARNKNGETALKMATSQEVIRILKEAGATE